MEDDLRVDTMFGGKVRFVPVKFRREWMGHPKGKKMKLDSRQVNILVDRGTVKIMSDKKELPKRRMRKQVSAPTKDKMLKGPEKSK